MYQNNSGLINIKDIDAYGENLPVQIVWRSRPNSASTDASGGSYPPDHTSLDKASDACNTVTSQPTTHLQHLVRLNVATWKPRSLNEASWAARL